MKIEHKEHTNTLISMSLSVINMDIWSQSRPIYYRSSITFLICTIAWIMCPVLCIIIDNILRSSFTFDNEILYKHYFVDLFFKITPSITLGGTSSSVNSCKYTWNVVDWKTPFAAIFCWSLIDSEHGHINSWHFSIAPILDKKTWHFSVNKQRVFNIIGKSSVELAVKWRFIKDNTGNTFHLIAGIFSVSTRWTN